MVISCAYIVMLVLKNPYIESSYIVYMLSLCVIKRVERETIVEMMSQDVEQDELKGEIFI
jgi:hypothetical protein